MVEAVKPSVDANRVTYEHGQVSEWFVNGPAGLEQGFTVPRAPAAGAPGVLTLSIAVSGNARASLSHGAQSVTLSHGARSLRYGGLTATDAAGRTLHSGLTLSSGALLLRVDTTGARYPITIDPLVQNGKKLTGITAGGESGAAQFGVSAALSADGGTALIGGPRDDERHGAAWVFVRSGSTWIQQGPKFTPGETEQASGEEGGEGGEECAEEEEGEEGGECSFGGSVALSADGSTALVGDPSATSRRGTVWVFTRSGSAWTRNAICSRAAMRTGEGRFGRSVALSADGSTGARSATRPPPASTARPGCSPAQARHGPRRVRCCRRRRCTRGSLRPQRGPLGRRQHRSDRRARRLRIRGRGVGVHEVGLELDATGHKADGWRRESAPATLAAAVALSADASTALIGGMTDNGGRGAAWVFARSGSSFAQQGEKLTGAPEGEPRFGSSVALSGDGNAALIGAPHDEAGLGTVTVFVRSGSTWSQLPEQLSGSEEASKGWSGSSVALSADAKVALIGAPHDDRLAGAAWAFSEMSLATVPIPVVTNVTPGRGPPQGGTTVTIRGENLTAATAVSFGSTPAAGFAVKSATVITAVTPPAPEGLVDVTVYYAGGHERT